MDTKLNRGQIGDDSGSALFAVIIGLLIILVPLIFLM